MLARIQKTWISQTLPVEIQNDTDTWDIVWYCLKKLNIYMTQQSHFWVWIQKKRNLCPHKNLYMNAYNNIIRDRQNSQNALQ